MTVYEDALKLHELHHGKLSIEPKVPCETPEDLTLAYTPGVAQPCLEINKDPENCLPLYRQGQHCRSCHRRYRGAGLRRYRRGRRSAGHGRQGVIDAPLRRAGCVPNLRRFQGSGRDHQGLQADFPRSGARSIWKTSALRAAWRSNGV